MKKFLLITAFSLAGAGMAAAQGAATSSDSTATATSPAATTAAPAAGGAAATMPAMTPQEFVANAASGGLFEVQSSQLALERSKSDAVKEFAQMMIADHTKANEELAAIATAKGLTVPAEIAGPPAQHMAAVQAAEGDGFDQVYMQHQLQAHQETVQMFQAEAQGGTDADLKAFAEKTLPTLVMHTEHAQGMTGN